MINDMNLYDGRHGVKSLNCYYQIEQSQQVLLGSEKEI